jgi:hypothetical protein
MATDDSRKAALTTELLLLTQRQQRAREDATFLGWQVGELDEYRIRCERISALHKQHLSLIVGGENLEAPDTLLVPELDAKPSQPT